MLDFSTTILVYILRTQGIRQLKQLSIILSFEGEAFTVSPEV
jgi:hypothetical protein